MNFRNISSWCIKNPVPPIVLFIGLMLAGLIAFMGMSVNNNPDIDFPAATIVISQPGAAPAEMENQITQKVEAAARSVNGIDEINSTIREGNSQTFVQFLIGTPTDRAVNDLRDAITQIRSDLPDGILEPQIARVDFAGDPILFVAAETNDMSLEQLSWYVDNNVSRRLLGVSGVASIAREGGVNRNIRVILDPAALQAQGITAAQVNAQLRQTNLNATGGRAEIAGSEQSVRVLGNAKTAYDLSQTRIIVPGGRTVRLADLLKGTTPAGASIVAPGGVVAQQSIKTPEGAAVGPCASAASARWYTAVGSTAASSSLLLSLLNPFPDDAIVDLAFFTDQGRAVPGDLQGIVVPGRSVLVVNVGDHVRRRDAVAAEVVARRGRLVVGRNFRKGTGSSTILASPSPAPAWYLPGGVRAEGVTNRLVVANPSDQDAEVNVELRLQEGAVEPFTLNVPAQDRAELNLDDARVPKGVAYAIVARSTGDVPVVVERSTEGRTGRGDVLGGRDPDRAWVAVAAGPRGQDALAIYNAGDAQAEVTVTPLAGDGVPLPGPLRIDPGVRATLRLDDKSSAKGEAVLVESNQVLVVERYSGDGAPTQGGAVGAALGRR